VIEHIVDLAIHTSSCATRISKLSNEHWRPITIHGKTQNNEPRRKVRWVVRGKFPKARASNTFLWLRIENVLPSFQYRLCPIRFNAALHFFQHCPAQSGPARQSRTRNDGLGRNQHHRHHHSAPGQVFDRRGTRQRRRRQSPGKRAWRLGISSTYGEEKGRQRHNCVC
jgi:hypothetical protein